MTTEWGARTRTGRGCRQETAVAAGGDGEGGEGGYYCTGEAGLGGAGRSVPREREVERSPAAQGTCG